ncbi:potassium channel family protein [Pontibacter locisalis]|uniref:Potassium channel family protein n=1 Tax=Pontibacter locisalis TaxID=1719035 RepID=A0ABW5IUL0_9BACT
MDSYLYLVTGICVVALTSYDVIYTTFARGAGIVTDIVTTFVWKGVGLFCKITKSKSVLNGAGIITVCSLLIIWVMLLWVGNTLIFMSDSDAVVNSTTNVPADFKERIYFTGYILSTMGNGDFKGGTDAWRIYSSFISFSGLILITIAISYIVPVLSAIITQRTVSIKIAAIGDSPQQILLNNWDGESFKRLEVHLEGLDQDIIQQGQLHLAYPVLHYFHNDEKKVSLVPNLAALDEALTLLLLYVPEDLHPGKQYIVPVRKAITSFLESVTKIFINSDGSEAPNMDFSELPKAGVPLRQPSLKEIEQLELRRQILKAMVNNDGWSWEQLCDPAFKNELDLPSVN